MGLKEKILLEAYQYQQGIPYIAGPKREDIPYQEKYRIRYCRPYQTVYTVSSLNMEEIKSCSPKVSLQRVFLR